MVFVMPTKSPDVRTRRLAITTAPPRPIPTTASAPMWMAFVRPVWAARLSTTTRTMTTSVTPMRCPVARTTRRATTTALPRTPMEAVCMPRMFVKPVLAPSMVLEPCSTTMPTTTASAMPMRSPDVPTPRHATTTATRPPTPTTPSAPTWMECATPVKTGWSSTMTRTMMGSAMPTKSPVVPMPRHATTTARPPRTPTIPSAPTWMAFAKPA